MHPTDILVVLLAISVSVLFFRNSAGKRQLPYPPGPKGLLFVGNIFDIKHDVPPHKLYAQWAREFASETIHLKMFNTHLVVLNSFEAAKELLDRRSALYSDRPTMTMLLDLIKLDWSFAIMPYGEAWRSRRRAFHKLFRFKGNKDLERTQLKSINSLLVNLAQDSENWTKHLRLMLGSLLINLTYGVEPTSFDHPYIALSEKTIAIVSEVGTPGAFLVDLFPLLKHVPSWMPGAGFKSKAKKWNSIVTSCAEDPFNFVKAQLEQGKENVSVTASALRELDESNNNNMEEELLKGASAIVYSAGADTTIGTITSTIMGLLLYPEVQKKAQAELDKVIGKNKLPEFQDLESLPYINAIVKESIRWQAVVPLGVPHRLMQGDVFDGMFIPPGSIVIGNAWAMLMDERVWRNPTVFSPERFLTPTGEIDITVRDPEDIAFGFGRRLCPGRALAVETATMFTACLLSTLEVTPVEDDRGQRILPDPGVEGPSRLTWSPPLFKCNFIPRSSGSLGLIKDTASSYA